MWGTHQRLIFGKNLKTTPDRRYLRRCLKHDYTDKGIYLVTIYKAAGLPNFTHLTGHLSRQENTVGLYHGDMWLKLHEAMSSFLSRYRGEQLSLIRDVIIPDHRHVILMSRKRGGRQEVGTVC